MKNYEINDKVKTSNKAQSVFRIVGIEPPLPLVGGVTMVLVINEKAKNPKIRRMHPKFLWKEDEA